MCPPVPLAPWFLLLYVISVMCPPVPLAPWFLLLYVISCSWLFMASPIWVHKLLGGFCPLDSYGLALPKILASGRGPVSDVNRVRSSLT